MSTPTLPPPISRQPLQESVFVWADVTAASVDRVLSLCRNTAASVGCRRDVSGSRETVWPTARMSALLLLTLPFYVFPVEANEENGTLVPI